MKKKFLIVIGVLLGVIALVGGGIVVHNKIQSNKENKAIEEKKLEEKKKKEEEKEKEKLEAEKEKKKLEAEQEAQRLKEENDQKIADLKVRKSNLQAKEITLKVQKNEEFMNNGFTEKYYQLSNELSDLSDEIRAVEREIDDLEDNTFEPVYEEEDVDVGFTDIEDFISDFTEDTQDETESIFEFSKYIFIIPLVVFITVFFVIVTIAIKSTKNFGSMIHGVSTKEMLNDLSDVAVKMAKDLNPTYKEFKCPNCNASLDPENTDIKKCNYCGAKLYKTVNTAHTHKNHSHTSNSHNSNTHDSNSHKTK